MWLLSDPLAVTSITTITQTSVLPARLSLLKDNLVRLAEKTDVLRSSPCLKQKASKWQSPPHCVQKLLVLCCAPGKQYSAMWRAIFAGLGHPQLQDDCVLSLICWVLSILNMGNNYSEAQPHCRLARGRKRQRLAPKWKA